MKINTKPQTVGELLESLIEVIDRQTAIVHKAHGSATPALKPLFGRLADECLDNRNTLTKIQKQIQENDKK